MEKDLAEINTVSGVRGSFLCDNQGKVIASAAPAGLDTATLNSIGRGVTLTLAVLETTGEAMSELDFTYDGARLVARDLANAVLILLCEPQVEMSMLRLTLNVVTTRLKGNSRIQSQFKARAVEKEVLQNEVDETSWYLLKALETKEVNDA
jgi:predicted regulator of Ras-like GTPase activity (Roadblock/LC7/MglB family)